MKRAILYLLLGGAGLAAGLGQPEARAQQPTMPSLSTLDVGRDPTVVLQRHRSRLALNAARQQRIVDDTSTLLRLAQEVQADVDAHDGALSDEDERKLEQMRKLAKEVQGQMKG